MPLLPGHGAVLRSVRLHSAGGDPLRARQRLERALADVDWSPPGLAPQALLFVRRLVADARRGVRPAREGGSFGQGVSAALREHARVARRPWLHADAAEAGAVCFNDEAELLACLLRDWVRGAVAQRWWWHGVLGHLDATRWLRVHAWPHAERLVPALVLLAERGEAVACVARLDDADAVQALRSVRRAYGVSDPVDTGTPPQQAHAEAVPRPQAGPAAQAVVSPAAVRDLKRLLVLVPELSAAPLRPAQRRLLALALALVRAPAWARTPAFALALETPGPGAVASLSTAAMPATLPRVAEQHAVTSAPASPAAPAANEVADATAPGHRRPTPPLSAGDATTQAQRFDASRNDASDPPAPTRTPPFEAALHPLATPGRLITETPAAPPAPVPLLPVLATRAPEHASGALPGAARHSVRTRYGGLFYLLNAALALRVYGDFTMPRSPGLALSPWDLLAWTGHAWWGDDFVRDPLWTLLASLSGRPLHMPPGRGFIAPTGWSLGATWLAPWGRVHRLQVHASAHRLRVLHPQGFVVFDVPRNPAQRPLQQARALCGGNEWLRSASLVRARAPVARVPRAAAARWLHHWLAYLGARLCRTLGVADAPRLLCCHEAVVEVGAATVDVHLALAALPLPIRFAGLDRDPGWIPAAGRTLMFRFT